MYRLEYNMPNSSAWLRVSNHAKYNELGPFLDIFSFFWIFWYIYTEEKIWSHHGNTRGPNFFFKQRFAWFKSGAFAKVDSSLINIENRYCLLKCCINLCFFVSSSVTCLFSRLTSILTLLLFFRFFLLPFRCFSISQ
jgi:hypothetical protein